MRKKASVVDEQKFVQPPYKHSDKERAVVESVLKKFRTASDERNRNFQYFDGLNLIEYIDDAVRRFTTNVDRREDIEDWQAIVHDQFTRNKVLAILAKVMKLMPVAEIHGRGEEDFRRAELISSIHQYAEEVDNYEEFMTYFLLESIVKGTAIGYEGVEVHEKIVKDVKGYGDDMKIHKNREIKTLLCSKIVPLEEFYPSSVAIRSIKEMPYCFWAKEMDYQKFQMDYGDMYEKAKDVPMHNSGLAGHEMRPFYMDILNTKIADGNVFLIKYYNQDVDEYVIIANGIHLNPLGTQEEISPLPWNHKELPFFDVKFDFFGSDFFYGKGMPDKLKTLQDVLNVLTNMLLDQSFLTIFPPLLTNGFDSIEDDYLRPGRRTPIDTQGLPINQAFMKLDLGTPTGFHQYILEHMRKIAEESSLDQVSQGVAGGGDRTTAQEIRVAAEGVAAVLGLWGRQINYGIKRKARLKISNELQFWTDPESPMIKKINGEDGTIEFNKAFNTFKIKNATLTNGKRGIRIIEMYKDTADLPKKSQVKARGMIATAESGRNVEIVAIPSPYIRDLDGDIILVPNSKSDATKDIEKAMQLEKVQYYLTFFPEKVNKDELFAQTCEKLGDDPSKIGNMKDDQQQAAQAGGAQPGAQQPGNNMANNMVQSQGIGAGNMQNLKDMQSMMG